MELLRIEDLASVAVFELRLSEAELQYLADSLAYVLKNLDDETLDRLFYPKKKPMSQPPEETREFAETTYKEIMDLIKTHCRDEFLDERFRQWVVSDPEEDD